MRPCHYIDKGASRDESAPCLSMGDLVMSYGDVQRFSYRMARALEQSGIAAGEHVAILSRNDPHAFAAVFAVSRAGCVWCPVNPRNEATENAFILENFDCTALIFHSRFAAMVERMLPGLRRLRLLVCLDADLPFAPSLENWWADSSSEPFERRGAGELAMLPGTGGTTGLPKGVMLSNGNLETMTSLMLMSYPFGERPVYLAMAPLTHAAGVLAYPILLLGGHVVIMPEPDPGEYLRLAEAHAVTHSFMAPTMIYTLLDSPALETTDLSALRCLWYGAAPIAPARLEEALHRIGPMGQIYGQTEAPMMITALSPADHYRPDGTIDRGKLSSAGRATPLVELQVVDSGGGRVAPGEVGEIVVKGSLVMMGYYKNPEADAEVALGEWHRTGDIGYVDDDGYLFIVDRAKDMIISGGFNVYSAEVERALIRHPAVLECAVFGLPDRKWGERVCAAVEPRKDCAVTPEELIDFIKGEIGGVKAPKSIEFWSELPRSKVGKVLKKDIRSWYLAQREAGGRG